MLKVHRPSELCKICILLSIFYFVKKIKKMRKCCCAPIKLRTQLPQSRPNLAHTVPKSSECLASSYELHNR